MALDSGTKLGPYEIQSPLGAGGMGEVYRARDTRLGRKVAIKVLPDHLCANPDSKHRFVREARAISSLNHPHICALYDIGTQEGIDFLVMEYLEGQTLAERLQEGAMPVEQVLKIGMEIADALDKVHHEGIVHRDLKPGNIMLTGAGAKLMDFGLAKPSPLAFNANADATTLTKGLTIEGTFVGTFQYMAPEQLESKEADLRSDVFAFGAVLYEMATGQPAFQGKTPASIVAAILTSEPTPITTLRPTSPPELDRLTRTALAKNPNERWQSAHDMGIALAGISVADYRHTQLLSPSWLRITAGVVSAGLLGLGAYSIIGKTNPSPALLQLNIVSPLNVNFSTFQKLFAIAPDGRELAFTTINQNGQQSLWVRRLDSLEAKELPGTDGADSPFWSPDSKHIGFYAHSTLKKVDPSGGQPEVICGWALEAGAPGGATWGRDGIIVFAPNLNGILFQVPAEYPADDPPGPAREDYRAHPATEAYQAHDEASHAYPEFLPDGRHFLFFVLGGDDQGIHIGSLDSTEHHLILRESSSMTYVEPGYLLFGRNGALMAQRFDAKRMQTLGEPTRIVNTLEAANGYGYSFSASNNGVLVYWTGKRTRAGQDVPAPLTVVINWTVALKTN